MPSKREQKFRLLAEQAGVCRLCPRMEDQPAVLGRRNGSLSAPVVFVAEAPGRLGSGRTGVPFQGDKSGENFQELIDHVGLKRKDIFITNAVLCNPLEEGNNSRPTAAELNNCAPYLEQVLELIAPAVVVTLGGVGLDAVNRLLGTRFKLADSVARVLPTDRYKIFPLYHPSPRVTHWRRTLKTQKKDFEKLLKVLKKET